MVIREQGATFQWRDPEPVQARRKVAMSSKVRFSVQITIGEGAGRIMRPEGLLEYRTLLLCLARYDVDWVEEQFGRSGYTAGSGKDHEHTLDLLVHMRSGARVGVIVKPYEEACRPEFRDLVSRIAAGLTPSVADRIVVVTERSHDAIDLHNAELFHGLRDIDSEVDAGMLRVVKNLMGPLSIAALVQPTGWGWRGERAAVRLVRSGVLETVRRERILTTSVVRRAPGS